MVALAGTALLVALAPAEVNGDGIGYLKAVRDGARYPGHLGYVPLLSACVRAWRWLGLGDATLAGGIVPGRLLSATSAGVAAAVLGAFAAGKTGSRARGLVAAAGLLGSAGLMLVGCDVECYAPATLALVLVVALLDEPSVPRAVLAGLALAAAVLLHIENALFALPALLLCRTTRARVALVAGSGPILAAIFLPALATVPHATHGFSYPLRVYTPALAAWGAVKAIVYAPYLHEASAASVATATIVGCALVTMLVALGWRGHGRVPLPRAAIAAWVVPYTVVGVAYFASDSERWIFLLPLFWLALAARVPPRRLALVVAAVLVANLALWLPRARDHRGLDRARATAAHLAPGTLVVGPGHGWDESLPLVADVELFPAVFYAAAGGGEAAMTRALDQAIARARGGPIVRVRVDDDDDPSGSLGYKELAPFGVDRARLRTLLDARGVRALRP